MQDFAFVLVLIGILLLYCEAIWIGRIYFGLMGAILIIVGFSFPWRIPVSPISLTLLACSLVCFGLEARFRMKLIGGIVATIALGGGAWKLGVSPSVAIPSSVLFGAVTILLLAIAKKARQNKQADL